MKRVVVLLLVSLLLSVCTNAAFEKVNTYNGNFSDVKSTAWYAENVKKAYELGFMNGKTEAIFDPDGSVTVAEALALSSRIHSGYYSVEISAKTPDTKEYRYDFDDPSIFVDLTKRNSRNDNGVSLKRAVGGIKDGLLVVQSDTTNSHGNYDPQITFAGLDLDTRVYNKLKIRMKRDELPNSNPQAKRNETLEIFFETSSYNSITSDKCIKYNLNDIADLSDWFEVEIDLSKHEKYVDYLKGLRFDPTNNNGIFYIDYLVFYSDSENIKTEWYEMYHDYAVDNGIVDKDKYKKSDMSKSITRRQLFDLFAAALPEEYFNPINNIKGIPDVARDEKNADVYLLLYNAGILLGSDSEGNLNPDSVIKRSEVAAIINRMALPESRVMGNASADWTKNAGEYDFEFNDPDFVNALNYEAESLEIKDGAIFMKALDRGEGRKPRFDPKISFKNVSINADEYTKIRIRMKAEFIGEEGTRNFDFFFMTEGDKNFSAEKGIHQTFEEYCYKDPAGWYVMEIDTRLHRLWSGTITAFRFDPANTNGNFTIDYIRFIKDDYNKLSTHLELVNAGYTATRLFKDETFENGFYVNQFEQKELITHGRHDAYCQTENAPLWQISPWWSGYDLIDDRDPTNDKYTISDIAGVNTVKYNPEEKSVVMRMNATKYYNGRPHILEEHRWLPHLIVSQDKNTSKIDYSVNTAAGDRMFVEVDLRLLDFKNTTNPEGINNVTYGMVFHMRTAKAPGDMVWFCMTLFHPTSFKASDACAWTPDSAAHQYMYGMPPAAIFDGVEHSFNPEKGKVVVSNEWKHIRVDITPHIERVVEWANRDNIFGTHVTKEDLYFDCACIGYEIHGNFDCTFEFKNLNMVSYNKD